MIDFINNIITTRKKTYLGDPNLIIQDYRQEIEKIEEYNGRQLLEMLQNADDESETDKEKTCYIKLSENQLIVANNGKQFSKGGMESLMYSYLSPKLHEQNKVGQKGLGFRSILSWANKITIKSYDFAVEFSKENAKNFLDELIKKNPKILEELKEKEKQEKFPIAILRCPKILEQIPEEFKEYDTYIMIDLKENQVDNVQQQINDEINKEVLLFLNKLESIIIESPNKNFEIEKEFSNHKILIREFDYDKDKTFEKEWNIKTKTGKHKDKNYELKIAWNENLDDKIGRIYSYFKTQVKFPFPVIIHGTFELSSNRNELNNDTEGHNKFLLKELIQLLIETALQISKNEISYNALKLLNLYNKDLAPFFEDNSFIEELKNQIKENKIFPTINNKYISYRDQPVFCKKNYAEILPKDKFEDLLLFTEDEEIIQTLKELEIPFFNDRERLFSAMSEISEKLEISQRTQLIFDLVQDYRDIPRKILPNIFIDQNGKIIFSTSEMFFPPSGEKIDIPSNLNLKIINSDLFSNLKKKFHSENAEIMEYKLKLFGIKVYRFKEIFRRIISDFKRNLQNKTDRINSIQNLILNLYELYISNKDKNIDIEISSDISIPILNRNNKETEVNKVYLGKDYENKLCEILYEYDQTKLVGSQKILGIEEQEFTRDFLLWLGVAEKPRKKIITIHRFDQDSEYPEYVIKKFPFKEKPIYPGDNKITSYQDLEQKRYDHISAKAELIEDIDEILKHNSNENIIYWFLKDSRILERMESNPGSKITIEIHRKHYPSKILHSDMRSYLLWKIKQTPWLSTQTGKRVKPTKCCISKTITKDFSPFIEIPKVDAEHQLFKDFKIKDKDIGVILLKIGVNKEISDFSTDSIYSILYNLHKIDKSGEKAKLIYRELVENFDDKKIEENSIKYRRFINTGLVYCQKNGGYSYEPIQNVYYVEDKIFGEDIISQFFTIKIDRRKGAKKIETLFGVKPLRNLEFELKSEPSLHELNEKLQNEIEELKPYLYAFRIQKDTDRKELKWLKDSKITICTKIETQCKNKEELKDFILQPYEFIYIKEKSEIYLCIDDKKEYSSIKDFRSDYQFTDSIAEIFSSILKIDTHRASFSRLFESDTEKKKHILKTELGDNDLETLEESKKKFNIVDDIPLWNENLRVEPHIEPLCLDRSNSLNNLNKENKYQTPSQNQKNESKPPLPTKPVKDQERFQKKIIENYEHATKKTYETKERLVKTSQSEIDRKTFLTDCYTNEDNIQFCQISKQELPFKYLPKGDLNQVYYFEAVRIFPTEIIAKETEYNYLCLCPLMAAMFKYVLNDDKSQLKTRILEADANRTCQISIEMNGEPYSIYFVETHLVALQTILKNRN